MTAPFGSPRSTRGVLHEYRHRDVVRDEQIRVAQQRVVDEFDERDELRRSREPVGDAL